MQINKGNKILSIRHKMLLGGVLCLIAVCLSGQVSSQPNQPKKKSLVYLLHSDSLRFDKHQNADAQIVEGNVVFRHDSVYMYCDSAYFYHKTNSLEAFGQVKMNQGDTLFLYGDRLFYDGNSQIATVRENVRMEHRNTILLTDSLNYDRVMNLGYYFEGGSLQDGENVLTSDWGEYSPSTKMAVFNYDVELNNPKFTLTSDTLCYHTVSKVANIVGPSDIVSEDNHIYSELGFYNTSTEQAELLKRSVLSNQGKTLTGDSLFYDRRHGFGEAFNNVVMNDTINKNLLTGDYCFYDELHENALVTQRAVAVDYSQGDSLFVHADTLRMLSYNFQTDSAYKKVHAYHKVRAFRSDIQAVCDSLVFSSEDSCLVMYRDPIVWNGSQQLLGEEIHVFMNDSTIDWAHITNQALVVECKDSVHYNQISGKEIKAYFVGREVRQVDVLGSVRVIYYPEEKDSTMIGMNISETSVLNMFMKDRKMEKMIMSPKSNGTLYPMSQIPSEKMYLENFAWFGYIRPTDKEDIFHWRGKKAGQELKKSERKSAPLPNQDLMKSRR